MSQHNNFSIKPFNTVGEDRKDKINKTILKPLPRLNQHLLMCAPTGSGKSTITLNLLLRFLKFKFDRVIFFSKTWDYDLYKDHIQVDDENINKSFSTDKIDKIINEQKEYQEEKKKPIFTLIIFDDFQDLFKKGSFLENFLCHCRHWNITVWVLAQYVKAISKLSRQQFTNIICFPALSNEEDLKVIAETAPIGKKKFEEACNIVNDIIKQTHDIHNFLFINKSLENKYWLNFDKEIF